MPSIVILRAAEIRRQRRLRRKSESASRRLKLTKSFKGLRIQSSDQRKKKPKRKKNVTLNWYNDRHSQEFAIISALSAISVISARGGIPMSRNSQVTAIKTLFTRNAHQRSRDLSVRWSLFLSRLPTMNLLQHALQHLQHLALQHLQLKGHIFKHRNLVGVLDCQRLYAIHHPKAEDKLDTPSFTMFLIGRVQSVQHWRKRLQYCGSPFSAGARIWPKRWAKETPECKYSINWWLDVSGRYANHMLGVTLWLMGRRQCVCDSQMAVSESRVIISSTAPS